MFWQSKRNKKNISDKRAAADNSEAVLALAAQVADMSAMLAMMTTETTKTEDEAK